MKEGVRYFPYSCGIWNERGQEKKHQIIVGGGGGGASKICTGKTLYKITIVYLYPVMLCLLAFFYLKKNNNKNKSIK